MLEWPTFDVFLPGYCLGNLNCEPGWWGWSGISDRVHNWSILAIRFFDTCNLNGTISPAPVPTYSKYHIAGNLARFLIWQFGTCFKFAKYKLANLNLAHPRQWHWAFKLPKFKFRQYDLRVRFAKFNVWLNFPLYSDSKYWSGQNRTNRTGSTSPD